MSSSIIIPLIMALLAVGWFAVAATFGKTNSGTRKLALIGGVLAALMCAAVIVVQAAKVAISAQVVIPLLVATIVEFGFLIALAAKLLGGKLTGSTVNTGLILLIAMMLIGVVLMFQPVTSSTFNLGFDFVLIGLLLFNVWSHIAPRRGAAVMEQTSPGAETGDIVAE